MEKTRIRITNKVIFAVKKMISVGKGRVTSVECRYEKMQAKVVR
jgi:hypothetical protein